MTAAGKITTARIQTGDRVLVKHYTRDEAAAHSTLDYLGKDWALGVSATKTGQGVEVARVLKVEADTVTGGRRDKRVYDVYTTAGVISNCAPSQTWTLAPEDAAGVKRAHVEALALNEVMDAYPVAEETPEARGEETEARHADSAQYHRTLAQRVEATPRLAKDPAKGEQINAWLERHNIRLEAMTEEAAAQCAKDYHAAMAKDRDEAEAENAKRDEVAAKLAEAQEALAATLDRVLPAAILEPAAEIRTRYHGQTLGQRRQARKNQKAARRRTRAKNR